MFAKSTRFKQVCQLLLSLIVASNPVQSHATYNIVFEFVKQNIMIDGIKGLRKIKENANGIFIAIKSKGDFFI